MVKFKDLVDIYMTFGSHAQEALDFMSDETNQRKFKLIQSQESQPVASILASVENTEETKILIAMDSGTFLTKEEWKAGQYDKDSVAGIAVMTPCVRFILGLHQWRERWSEDTDHVLTEKHTEAQALQVVSGFKHTKALVEAQEGEGNTAAKMCWNYWHKNLQWYLPSLLELNVVCANKEDINELLELVGGELLDFNGCYWSSTEYSVNSSWFVYFGNGSSGYGSYKSSVYVVRPAVAI